MNHISSEWLIVWTHIGGWGIFVNDGVESDCMGGSVESDRKYKSDVID